MVWVDYFYEFLGLRLIFKVPPCTLESIRNGEDDVPGIDGVDFFQEALHVRYMLKNFRYEDDIVLTRYIVPVVVQ